MSALVGIDVGNTHTTVGWWEGGEWRHEWRLTTKAHRTKDEWTVSLEGVLRRAGFPERDISTLAISSVVPAMTAYMQFVARELGLTPIVIGADHIKSVQIAYDPPQAVGPDRLCGIAAAISRFGAPIIVVDLGTATVIDVVDIDRVYRGGIIAPGVATAAESLNKATALLPKVELAFPPSVVGKNTVEAIQSGILYGALSMIDGLVSRIQLEIGKVPVVATGGFADLLQGQSSTITHVDQRLVLEGIRLLATGEWS
ncbi:MAG: type III pantothenate kinase [bacterium]|nr:type III pantothenate kinase [bacterium]